MADHPRWRAAGLRLPRAHGARPAGARRPSRPARLRAVVPPALVVLLAAGAVTATQGVPPPPPAATGNGVEQLPAGEILLRARQAAQAAGSVHLVGVVQEGNHPVELDLRLQGRQGIGRISSNGTSVLLIKAGRDVHVSGDDDFYTHFAGLEAAGHLAGRWTRLPARSPALARSGDLFDLDALLDRTLAPRQQVHKVGTRLVGGARAVEVRSTTGSSVLVALDGEPYPLRLEPSGKDRSKGYVQLDGWGEPVHVPSPSPNLTADPPGRSGR